MSLLLFGVSLFTNLFTIYILISGWTGNCIPKPYNDPASSPKSLKITIIGFIILSLASIVIFGISGIFRGQNMDAIKEEVNSIIGKAKSHAAAKNYFSNIQKIIDERNGFLSTLLDEFHWKEILEKHNAFNQLVPKVDTSYTKFKTWLDTGDHSSCANHSLLSPHLINIKSMNNETVHSVKSLNTYMNDTIVKLGDLLKNQTIELNRQIGIARNTTNDRFSSVAVMLAHFQHDIDGSETIRQQWFQQIDETSPTLTTQKSATIIVNVTFVMLILFTLVSGYFIIRPKHEVFLPKLRGKTMVISMVVSVILFTAIWLYIISMAILLMSKEVLGTADCPLNIAATGLANFTRTFYSPSGANVSLCQTGGSTFLSHLGQVSFNTTLITPKILEYTVQLSRTIDPRSIGFKIEISTSFADELGNLTSLRKSMEPVDTKCKVPEVEEFWKLLGELLTEGNRLNELVGPYNGKFEKTLNDMIRNKYSEMVELYQKVMKDIEANFNAIDFSCQPIVDSFNKPAILICEEFKVETFEIPLIWTLLACMISLVIHIEVKRMLIIRSREEYELERLSMTSKLIESGTVKKNKTTK